MERGNMRAGFDLGGEEMKREVRRREHGPERSSQMFLNAANLHPNKSAGN